MKEMFFYDPCFIFCTDRKLFSKWGLVGNRIGFFSLRKLKDCTGKLDSIFISLRSFLLGGN